MRIGFRGAMILGFLFLPLAAAPANASPMTPFQNGNTWIAAACKTDSRDYHLCAEAKCEALYPRTYVNDIDVNAGARHDCYMGALMGMSDSSSSL